MKYAKDWLEAINSPRQCMSTKTRCQNCNTEEMIKGTTPVAAQRGEISILIHKIPAMVCPSCEFYVLDESIKKRVEEILDDAHIDGAEVVITRYAEKEEWEDD